MTEALLELHGHSRRVGLVEWHPTTNNILFSAGYDYKVGSRAAGGHVEGEGRASLGACRKHCYFPERVNPDCLICSFLHSLHTTEPLLCAPSFLGSTEAGGICTAFVGADGLEMNATPCPHFPDGRKGSNQSCWRGENGAPAPSPRQALKRGVPATGTWPGTFTLHASCRNYAQAEG